MKNQTLAFNRRGLLISGAAIALSGCGSLLGPSGPPRQIYLLAPALKPVEGPDVTWQLTIGTPACDNSLDSQRIALHRGVTLDYYADAQWTDQAPNLIQTLLVEAFEKSGHIAAVARDSDGLHADYLLQMELRDFEAHYDSLNGIPTVVVDLFVRMLALPRREVVSSLNARHEVRASQNSIPAVVDAFNLATGQTLEQIVGWALRAPGSAMDRTGAAAPAKAVRHHKR
jgi:cholesterol transport system auxiliary component